MFPFKKKVTCKKISIKRISIAFLTWVFLGLGLIVTTACSNEDDKFFASNASDTYNLGLSLYKNRQFSAAAKTFEKIPYLFPYSPFIKNAHIMAAYSYYVAEDKVNAGTAVDVFLSLYPNDPLAPYALYLRGMSYFEQIEDVRRDQSLTQESLKSFQQLIGAFPNSVYAKDATAKRELLLDQLAGKEMTVGRFYLYRGEYVAALGRFKSVLDDFNRTSHTPEALARMVEIYLNLGVREEAKRYAILLGNNYQASDWYQYAYDLLQLKPESKKANYPKPPKIISDKNIKSDGKVAAPKL